MLATRCFTGENADDYYYRGSIEKYRLKGFIVDSFYDWKNRPSPDEYDNPNPNDNNNNNDCQTTTPQRLPEREDDLVSLNPLQLRVKLILHLGWMNK